jgi:tetratricopeptide (TPR) repeat protein
VLDTRLQLTRAAGDAAAEDRMTGNLGAAYFALGDLQKAVELFWRRVEMSRASGDRVSEGRMLGNLGAAYRQLRQFDRARECMQRNLDLAREIGDRIGEEQAIGNLAVLERNLGNPHRAAELLKDRIQAARELGDRRGEAIALFNASTAYRDMGEMEIARSNALDAWRIFHAIGDANADRASSVRFRSGEQPFPPLATPNDQLVSAVHQYFATRTPAETLNLPRTREPITDREAPPCSAETACTARQKPAYVGADAGCGERFFRDAARQSAGGVQ